MKVNLYVHIKNIYFRFDYLYSIQFNDVVDFSENLANNGKCVIVAALDGTFQRKPFGSVLSLIPLAEQVTKLSAVCVICQNDAAFSLRTTEETQVEVIGGADKYIAVCRRCYHDHSNKHKQIYNVIYYYL